MLDDQGRAVRHRAGQASVPRLRRPRTGRGALYGAQARHRRSELAHAALSARDQGERPRALGAGAGRSAGIRRRAPASARCAALGRAAEERLCRRADALPEGGAGVPAGREPRAAGRRNGAGQDRSGAGLSGGDGGLSGAPGRAAASGAQLDARDGALPRDGGRRAHSRHPRADAVQAARGRHLHHPLSAAARLEERAARQGLAHGHIRRNAGAAPRRNGEILRGQPALHRL